MFHQLARKHATVVLPTIALAEVLVPVPPSQRGTLIAEMERRFHCPTLDIPATAIAADLWSRHQSIPADLQYSNRHVLRADTLIVAAARSAGATEFYSHDAKCRALANLIMTAYDLPTEDHNDMYLMPDIRRGEDELPATHR
jgi:hypothetical protein